MEYVTNVKLERVKKDIKQYQLAAIAGITPQYLRLIEIGKANNPSNDVMERLAIGLGTSVGELFFEK